MRVTTFNAIKNHNKKPVSPYDIKSENADCFEFTTHEVNSLKEAYLILTNNWILTNPICIENPIITRRTKENISQYRCPNPGCVILDIDKVKSHTDMMVIISFFKKSDFNIILGKSKGWNGTDNFNLKGYIETTFNNEWTNNRTFMNILNDMIGDVGVIDGSASTDTSVQAPLLRNEIFVEKYDSITKISDDWITLNNKVIKTKVENTFIQQFDTSKLVQICYQIYSNKGFNVIASRGNTVNWSHPNEIKSKGGYFTYVDSPHIMYHHEKSKSFSIFNEIRNTKEGQKFIKEETAYNLKKQFEEHREIYSHEISVNKQWLNVDQKMKQFISKFLREGDIFKLKSAMGTGKSWIIDEIINQSQTQEKRVLLVSNRISVANDYAEKYNIKTYQQSGDDVWLPGENLIVQMDSLWRYDLRNFDIVILDEFVSLMFQAINSMQSDMRPYNAAKFYHILKDKQLVMADAFLSGYEDSFYDNKKIFYIHNSYRDKIDITYYENHNTFVESIIDKLKTKSKDETVTASIMSNNVLHSIYDIVIKEGFKVFKLTGSTGDDTKKIIYKLFEDDVNDKWDLLLYSPTLTVGVSNMNNCTHHFHYDGSNSADVISSLQMVKRSRKMKHLHIFQKERILLEPTDVDILNDLFNQNIEMYFKGKNGSNGITINVDENANFVLSPIGKFMNKIQALHNRLENNHKLSFNVLLNEQFKFESTTVKGRGKLDFNQCIKETKDRLKQEKISLLEMHNFEYVDNIEAILKSGRTLTEKEKLDIMLYELEQKINTTDKNTLIDIARADIESNYKLTNKISNLVILYKKDLVKLENDIDTMLSSGTKTKEFKERTNLLRDMSKLFNFTLDTWYSQNKINEIQKDYKLFDFKNLLISIGYKKRGARMVLNEDVQKYFKYFL